MQNEERAHRRPWPRGIRLLRHCRHPRAGLRYVHERLIAHAPNCHVHRGRRWITARSAPGFFAMTLAAAVVFDLAFTLALVAVAFFFLASRVAETGERRCVA